jgi:hypothetical protein
MSQKGFGVANIQHKPHNVILKVTQLFKNCNADDYHVKMSDYNHTNIVTYN